MPSTDDVAYEGFETLDQRGKKAKRSGTKADLASSDARKLRRAPEAAARPVARADRPVDRAEHAHDGARLRADMNRAIRLADDPVPSSPLAGSSSGTVPLATEPQKPRTRKRKALPQDEGSKTKSMDESAGESLRPTRLENLLSDGGAQASKDPK